MLLHHGTTDQIIPFSQGTRLRDAWCAGGARVERQEHQTDHIFGVLVDVAPWLDARFEGQPFSPTCN